MKTIISIIISFILVTPALADHLCGCTRETEDPICKAYYEVLDIGLKVKVTCEKKEKKDGKHERVIIRVS